MNYFATKILKFITDQNVISDEVTVQDFYKYGIEISISSLLNIILVLSLGILIHHLVESVIFLLVFILIRSFTGGYHADTYFRCNLLMCVTFIITVYVNTVTSDKISLTTALIMILFTEFIVLVLGPIENKNKPIAISKRMRLKVLGLSISLAKSIIGLIFLESYIGTMIIYTGLLIAILMIASIIKKKRGELYEGI